MNLRRVMAGPLLALAFAATASVPAIANTVDDKDNNLSVAATRANGEEPDPGPEPTPDPDPEPTPDPDPEPTFDPDPEPTFDPDPEPTFDPGPEPTPDSVIPVDSTSNDLDVVPAFYETESVSVPRLATTGVNGWLGLVAGGAVIAAGVGGFVLLRPRKKVGPDTESELIDG